MATTPRLRRRRFAAASPARGGCTDDALADAGPSAAANTCPTCTANTLFVTRELVRQDPGAVRGMVRAFNRALADSVQDPDAAIDGLMRHAPGADRRINHARLVGTLRSEMAHLEGARSGIGDMDDARLTRLIALLVQTKKLPRLPTPGEVFDRSFLPPEPQRIRSLARRA